MLLQPPLKPADAKRDDVDILPPQGVKDRDGPGAPAIKIRFLEKRFRVKPLPQHFAERQLITRERGGGRGPKDRALRVIKRPDSGVIPHNQRGAVTVIRVRVVFGSDRRERTRAVLHHAAVEAA